MDSRGFRIQLFSLFHTQIFTFWKRRPTRTPLLWWTRGFRLHMMDHMAEATGFEPARAFRPYTLSKRAPSTTRTHFHSLYSIISFPRRQMPASKLTESPTRQKSVVKFTTLFLTPTPSGYKIHQNLLYFATRLFVTIHFNLFVELVRWLLHLRACCFCFRCRLFCRRSHLCGVILALRNRV